MKRLLSTAAFALIPMASHAQDANAVITNIVTEHIVSGFDQLAVQTSKFAKIARSDCDPQSGLLRDGYSSAFDAWLAVSHLRFGPTETNNRAFALAFWPDSRGATPRALATLIADQDPIAKDSDRFAQVSIAARGFYAMEYLLFDVTLNVNPEYTCTLVQTISTDMASNSTAIAQSWRNDYAQHLLDPTPEGKYRSEEEVLQELFKALTAGLQFTSETRLGRPLGTFDRPRPTRAEAWRSERSARNVALSLAALQDLAGRLSANDAALSAAFSTHFEKALKRLKELDDPVFAGVATPQTRLKIEVAQQVIDVIRAVARDELGPTLGVAAGFNSLDGD